MGPQTMPAGEIESHRAQIMESGYTILERAVDPETTAVLLQVIDRLMDELEIPYGKNRFLGANTRRIFNLLARDRVFQEVPVHPFILPLVERVLDPGCLISSLTAIEMHPGQAAQPFHADDGSIPLPRPHVPLACVAIWALTDFTAENGATQLVPSSHRFTKSPGKGERPAEVVEAQMPGGSVLVYDGAMWHAGGANRSSVRRVGIVANYCAGWVRQEESQLLALEPALVRTFSSRLQELVGYSVYRGQFGHVDQVNPRTMLDPEAETRMVWERMR